MYLAPFLPRGFTLVELLVTIALLVILMYMVATTFTAAHKAFADTRAAVEAHQTARAALDMLRDEISCATLIDQGTAPWRFLGQDGGSGSDTIRFTTTAFQWARSQANLVTPTVPVAIEVRYRLDGATLKKSVDWDPDPDADNFDPDPEEGVGFRITSINFRYFDAKPSNLGWMPDGNWSELRLPAVVEVTVVIESTDSVGRKFVNVFSDIIYLPQS